MSECKTCGRDDGHWIGCEKADEWKTVQRDNVTITTNADVCAFGDCMNPKRPKGKGPAPKYCEDHSDPKNRK